MVTLVTITNWAQQIVAMGTHRASGGNEQEPWCIGLEANSVAWFLPCLYLLDRLSPTCAPYSSHSLEPQVSICLCRMSPLKQPAFSPLDGLFSLLWLTFKILSQIQL